VIALTGKIVDANPQKVPIKIFLAFHLARARGDGDQPKTYIIFQIMTVPQLIQYKLQLIVFI